MLTEKDFIEKFESYSDEQLNDMRKNIGNYGPEAQIALQKIIESKGGSERLNNSLAKTNLVAEEIRRIQRETHKLGQGGVDEEFIQKTASSAILSADQVREIVNNQYDHVATELEDKKVDQQTIGRCIVAGIIAVLVSGSAFGGLLIYTGAIHILIIVGLALVCYAIVKSITKKSKHNSAVFLTTFLAFILSFLLGYVLFIKVGPGL